MEKNIAFTAYESNQQTAIIENCHATTTEYGANAVASAKVSPCYSNCSKYESELNAWLSSSRCIRTFKQRVSNELAKLNVSGWGYVRLDIPAYDGIAEQIGSDFTKQSDVYTSNAFYEVDFMLAHAKSSNQALFQSDISKFLDKPIFESESVKRNREILKMTRSFGFNNYLYLPLVSDSDNTKVMLTLSTKGMSANDFVTKVGKHIPRLSSLLRMIDSIGTELFPESFIKAKKHFDKITKNGTLDLLRLMAQEDLTLYEAAGRIHMSVSTAEKKIKILREKLGTKTTSGALRQAILKGYITV